MAGPGLVEPYVGPNSVPAAEVRPVAHAGPLTLYREHFNVAKRDPERHDQYFVCRTNHLHAVMLARISRRLFTG